MEVEEKKVKQAEEEEKVKQAKEEEKKEKGKRPQHRGKRVAKKVFDVIRYVISTLLLGACVGILLYAIVKGRDSFWTERVPWPATLVILCALLWVLGVLEGFQVALVEICKNPIPQKEKYARAVALQRVASKGKNLERFVLGRQVIVVVVVFLLAKIITLVEVPGFPMGFDVGLLQTGLVGTMVVITFGQLIPQVLAAQFPVHFANFPLMNVVFYSCLLVEFTGLTHATWILGPGLAKLLRFKKIRFESKLQEQSTDSLEGGGVKKSPSDLHVAKMLSSNPELEEANLTPQQKEALSRLMVAGSSAYPTPHAIAHSLQAASLKVPLFLPSSSSSSSPPASPSSSSPPASPTSLDDASVPPHMAALALHAHLLLREAKKLNPSPERERKELVAKHLLDSALQRT